MSGNRLMKNVNLAAVKAGVKRAAIDAPVVNMMKEPAYLRQSSSLINDALQKGFDVLQLANGDIVTTGTKTVVYQYTWDAQKNKLTKTKPADGGMKKMKLSPLVEAEEDEDAEMESEEA